MPPPREASGDALPKDCDDPILSTWNWSFLPLDLADSSTGLGAVALARRDDPRCRALVSLALTSASRLQAIAFWALRGDFDIAWWAPNLFLLVYPAPFVVRLLRAP